MYVRVIFVDMEAKGCVQLSGVLAHAVPVCIFAYCCAYSASSLHLGLMIFI